MSFTSEITVSDITAIISVVLAIIGGVFAYYQWRKSNALRRAEYINELTEKIRTDKDIRDTVYILDYGDKWYCREFHKSGKKELRMDKTLSYFSYICYLKKQKIIYDKEFDFFRYEIKRILVNDQIQDYFYNLYHFANKNGEPITFKHLFDYGEELKVFDNDFYDKNSYKRNNKYNCYLEF
ncbi:MAG: hypothetical protein ACI4TA_00400 [Acetatifactor sp.]